MMTVTYDLDTWREGDQVFSAMAKCVGGAYVLAEDYEALQSELAERQENLNVQDNVIDGLREEIAALRAERATLSNGLMIQTDQVEHSEKVIEELEKVAEHAAALFYNHELTETWDALEEALRSAGYLKEDGDE